MRAPLLARRSPSHRHTQLHPCCARRAHSLPALTSCQCAMHARCATRGHEQGCTRSRRSEERQIQQHSSSSSAAAAASACCSCCGSQPWHRAAAAAAASVVVAISRSVLLFRQAGLIQSLALLHSSVSRHARSRRVPRFDGACVNAAFRCCRVRPQALSSESGTCVSLMACCRGCTKRAIYLSSAWGFGMYEGGQECGLCIAQMMCFRFGGGLNDGLRSQDEWF